MRRVAASVHGRVAALLLVVGIAACAGPDPGALPRVVDDYEVAPYGVLQDCVRLAAGDRLDYRFESSETVQFAIQYHQAGAVLAPIVREGTRGDGAVFAATDAREYCLVWEAGAAGARLQYHFSVR
ncbi:MAG: hypothetical protein M3Z31_00100 [Pseudomonadota bacterium]|nr:hypothetical protein [Pseudomonadota bacterium]